MKVILIVLLAVVATAERIIPGSAPIQLTQEQVAQRRQDNGIRTPFNQRQRQQRQRQGRRQRVQQQRRQQQINPFSGSNSIDDTLPTFGQQSQQPQQQQQQQQQHEVPAIPFRSSIPQTNSITNFLPRGARQENVNGGVDFSGCTTDPDTGLCCVEEEETTTSLQSDPVLECTHKNVEKCHYTYVTRFNSAQEEICEENFEKICQITFKQEAVEENTRKCYKPLIKTCNGQGPEECRTVFESACTTRYIEKQPGRFVGDTACEKLPVEICGAGCSTEEGPEECHDKTITSLIDVPEEQCDLNPQQTCRFQTKLVPNLAPEHECTIVPQEICNLKFTQPEQVEKPLTTKWCLDPTPSAPGESYDESAALTQPLGRK